MKLINKDGLLGRLTLSIFFTALAVGFITSELFYRVIYLESLKQAEIEISMLHETVAATTSIAAYLDDTELASEVVNGLVLNGVVHAAKIETEAMVVESEGFNVQDKVYDFDISSPFSENTVGKLLIIRNGSFIANRAAKNATYNTQALIVQAVFISAVTILIVFLLVSKPLTFISKQLSSITPPSKTRLRHPVFHRKGEFGSLIKDINSLLSKTEKSLNHEQQYRKEIEILEQRFRLVFDNAPNPIVLTDPVGNMVLSNQAFIQLVSQVNVEMQKNLGLFLNMLFEDGADIESTFKQQLALGNTATGEYKLKQSASSQREYWYQVIVTTIRTEDFKDYIEISLHDISNKKRDLASEQQKIKLEYDPLTGALTRQSLIPAMKMMEHTYANYAVIAININSFKNVNKQYGSLVGDEVLRAISQRFKDRLRQDDAICRWGGDEFVLLLAHVNEKNVHAIVGDINAEMCKVIALCETNVEVQISASLGVSLYPNHATNSERLVELAEEAMQQLSSDIPTQKLALIKLAG